MAYEVLFSSTTRRARGEAADGPRRAGVSSFGIGGTNAHVVLEEAPPRNPSGESRRDQLIVLSAKTAAALDAATVNLDRRLSSHTEIGLADAAYTRYTWDASDSHIVDSWFAAAGRNRQKRCRIRVGSQ